MASVDDSLVAATYQKSCWFSKFLESFTESFYPPEAVRLRRVFEHLAREISARLQNLYSKSSPQPGDDRLTETRNLGKAIQQLYACLRYLQASDAKSCLPGIQVAISRLVEQCVTPALGGIKTDQIVALVRPQWNYNLKYVDLLFLLEEISQGCDILPWSDAAPGDSLYKLLVGLGGEWVPPRYVAVVSFAGLDRDDVLLYPLLAHEIGHFLYYSYVKHESQDPLAESLPTLGDIYNIADSYPISDPSASDDEKLKLAQQLYEYICEFTRSCLAEIIADLLAVRMTGPAYFIALTRFFKAIIPLGEAPHAGTRILDDGYPSLLYRLHIVLEELMAPGPALNAAVDFSAIFSTRGGSLIGKGQLYLEEWYKKLGTCEWTDLHGSDLYTALYALAESKVQAALPKVGQFVRGVVPDETAWKATGNLIRMIELLMERVPPFLPVAPNDLLGEETKAPTFGDILTSGWFYQLGHEDAAEAARKKIPEREQEYRRTCALVYKALELLGAREAIDSLSPPVDTTERELFVPMQEVLGSGVASGPLIMEALSREDPSKRLFVIPVFNRDPVQAASLDVHLGNWFRVSRRSALTSIDLTKGAQTARVRGEGQDEIYVRYEKEFVLHPSDFALGITLEYFALPGDLMAYVEGKSGLGRTGLIIATSSPVAPGFKGCIVLELVNGGTVPLILRPGMKIAQLVLHTIDRRLPAGWAYSGQYQCQVRP